MVLVERYFVSASKGLSKSFWELCENLVQFEEGELWDFGRMDFGIKV